MEIPKEIISILSKLNNGMVWIYIVSFFVIMYLLISLLTWSFIKPLKYLGIPTIMVGILLIIIKLVSVPIVSLLGESINIIKLLLPVALKPLLLSGILCILLGILMIVLYVIINKFGEKQAKTQTELT